MTNAAIPAASASDATRTIASMAGLACQCSQQLAVNAAKATVTHHQDAVAITRFGNNRRHQLIQIVIDHRLGSNRLQRPAGIPAQVGGVAEHLVGLRQAGRQLVLHHAQLHRRSA